MENKYVIQKYSNGSLYVGYNEMERRAGFCLHPNISDTINEARKETWESANDRKLLLENLGEHVRVVNLNDLL